MPANGFSMHWGARSENMTIHGKPDRLQSVDRMIIIQDSLSLSCNAIL